MKYITLASLILFIGSCGNTEDKETKAKAKKAQSHLNEMGVIQEEVYTKYTFHIQKAFSDQKRNAAGLSISSLNYETCSKVKSKIERYISLGQKVLKASTDDNIDLNNKSIFISYIANASSINKGIICDTNYTMSMESSSNDISAQFDKLESDLLVNGEVRFNQLNDGGYSMSQTVIYTQFETYMMHTMDIKVAIDKFISAAKTLKLTPYNQDILAKIKTAEIFSKIYDRKANKLKIELNRLKVNAFHADLSSKNLVEFEKIISLSSKNLLAITSLIDSLDDPSEINRYKDTFDRLTLIHQELLNYKNGLKVQDNIR